MSFQLNLLQKAARRLSDVVADPNLWPDLLTDISEAIGATGATLLRTGLRARDVPRTASVDELVTRYFDDGWDRRDLRTRGLPEIIRGNVIGDQDVATAEEMRREAFYNELIYPFGFRWFAGVGFRAGPDHWAVSIQRTADEGMFTDDEKHLLAIISGRLTEVATLSKAVGEATLTGMRNALSLVRQPAILVNQSGTVIETNAEADALLRDSLRIVNRRFVAQDPGLAKSISGLIERLRLRPDGWGTENRPIVVLRRGRRPLIMRALPVDGAARSPFLGAVAILLLTDLDSGRPQTEVGLIEAALNLTPAEARLAAHLARGENLHEAAAGIGIARETARNQLKSALGKTGTHRQGELVTLVSRLDGPLAIRNSQVK